MVRLRRPMLEDLPPAHQRVVCILADAGPGGLSWDGLVARAKAEGISEHEVELIMFGRPVADSEKR